MFQLRFTTLVEAPLTVAFDVARALGRPWGTPLEEVVSRRPLRDVYAVGPGSGWRWLTQLKGNRLVNPDGAGNRPLADCAIGEAGTRVHLQGYGFVHAFRIVSPDGDTAHWATGDERMDDLTRRMGRNL